MKHAVALAVLLLTSLGWSEPLPAADPAATVDVTLEGSARIEADARAGGDVLVLDGEPGSYGRYAAPKGVGRLRNFRAEVKVRIDERRAATVPLGCPGSFLIYFSGEGVPWALIWTDKGRATLAGKDPVSLGVWHDVVFEYRADDYGKLWVDGRSVLSFYGRGLLTQGGPEMWLGRYYWVDPDNGETHERYMRGAVARPGLTILPDDDLCDLGAEDMSNLMVVSWGDAIVVGEGWRKLNRLEHVEPFVQECLRFGIRKVLMRCSGEIITTFHEMRMHEDHWYLSALKAVEGDIHAEMIRQCHAVGIKVYAYSTIFDEGSPTSILYGGNAPFFWQSRFTIEHPEYLMESRDGTARQWGVPCFAYPEVRRYMVSTFEHLMRKWPFDGIYICTRTHSKPAEFADQFGYNQPIADEFQRRYGVDIRTEAFDRSRWWDLQGEYLTELLREFRQTFADDEIIIGIPRSDYIGPPYGNMRLDWRTWCEAKFVDGIVLGVISGGWHYPNTRNLPGYVQSQQDDVAIRDVGYDLGQWFGPWCKEHGIDLYLQRGMVFSDEERELLENPGMTGFMLGFRQR